jgi:D-serine deaminase-like pyridoxal phosphate-dependent protein
MTATVRDASASGSSSYVGGPVQSVPTPCLVVDLDRLEANITRWQGAMDACGTRLRPHIKTHKIPEIARLQIDAGALGIAVAKVAEAEVFAAAGIDDIVVAYPVFGEEKWRRVAVIARDVRLTVNADSAEAISGLSAAAAAAGVEIGVQLEVDSGFHRCGVDAADIETLDRLARLAQRLPGLRLDGVTTHRGVFFAGAEAMTIGEAGRAEGELVVGVAERLRARGVPVPEVTAGGTITGRGVAEVPGITEVRAGTYVFNDLMQLGFGSASSDDLALQIQCTVVSAPLDGHVTVDGGSKTFSGDRGVVGAASRAPSELARSVDGRVLLERISEEHGMARVVSGSVALGDRLPFYPTHACTAVNLSDELYGVRDDTVEVVWPVRARGKRT